MHVQLRAQYNNLITDVPQINYNSKKLQVSVPQLWPQQLSCSFLCALVG